MDLADRGQGLAEGLHHGGVELLAGAGDDLPRRLGEALRVVVELRRRHRLEGVDQRHHAPRPRDRVALQALRVAGAVPAFVVRQGEDARELEERIVVLADDLGAEFRVPADVVPVRLRELAAALQDLRGDAELADVVQWRGLEHHVADLRLRSRGFGDDPGVLGKPHDAVPDGGALVVFHRAAQPADQLQAGVLELPGALAHQRLQLQAAVGHRQVGAHPLAQQDGVDGLGEVVVGAESEALDLVLDVLLAGQEDHRDGGRGRVAFQQLADLETGVPGHDHVEQDQVRLGLFERHPEAAAPSSAVFTRWSLPRIATTRLRISSESSITSTTGCRTALFAIAQV